MYRREEIEWWQGQKGFEEATRASQLGKKSDSTGPQVVKNPDLVRETSGSYTFSSDGKIVCRVSSDGKGWWRIINGTTELLRRAQSLRYWSRKSAYAVVLQAVGRTNEYTSIVEEVVKGSKIEDPLPEMYLELTMSYAAHDLMTTVDGLARLNRVYQVSTT